MSTNSGPRRIVVIDDSPEWMDALEALLREYGEVREIQKLNRDAFLERYQKPHHFDDVDYCFVDLELGVRTTNRRTDKYGLTQVLPRIRSTAPWVPAACVSMWITNDAKILHELSVSDFDGLYPKELIGGEDEETEKFCAAPNFNRELWSGILHDLGVKRIAALTGRSVSEVAAKLGEAATIELVSSQALRSAISEIGECELREAIAALGLGGKKVALTEIVSGFSGVFVIKAEVFGTAEGGSFRAKWLFKIGKAPAKLAREASAHRRIFCRGVNRLLIVGQLYPNPVFWKGIGIIAYGYEDQTRSALDHAKTDGIQSLANGLLPIPKEFYSSPEICPCDVRGETERWIGRSVQVSKAVASAEQPMVISRAIIHGDLHLRNILISNGKATLIDFARSGVGPVAIDAAKIVADTIVFVTPEMLCELDLDWSKLECSAVGEILSLFGDYLKADDDKRAFSLFLGAFLRRYAEFSDVPVEIQQALRLVNVSKIG